MTLIASGTATLEAALFKRPMVIGYRMHAFSWQLMKRMSYQPWVGLPNILCREFVVPELLQEDCEPEALARAVLAQLDDAAGSATAGRSASPNCTSCCAATPRAVPPMRSRKFCKPEQLGLGWRGPGLVAGVDEAGRGPLAGPVVAAAVILDELQPIQGLADSKVLSPRRREQLFDEIRAKALCCCVAEASVEEIDR